MKVAFRSGKSGVPHSNMALARLMSTTYYLGLAPLSRGRSRSAVPFLQQHFAQARACFFWSAPGLCWRCPRMPSNSSSWFGYPELWLAVALLLALGALALMWIRLLGLGLAGS